MNLETALWDEQTYAVFLKYLRSFADEKLKKFHEKIINDELKTEIIGVRTPVMRDIARRISKGDYKSFLKFNTYKTHEEKMIAGILIGLVKIEYPELMRMLKDFVPHISNWGLTDITAIKFKQIEKNKTQALTEITAFLHSENPWEIRLGLILLLALYVDAEYIEACLAAAASVRDTHYYVRMGNAWLLSVCYIKFPEQTAALFKKNILNPWTQNKAVQKIRESLRVSPQEKENVLVYKR
ncbi:MAG: DNA alkylation repair protein [Clostridiales bacterium]|jgi:3-methyladenine DNA glycosylase AlkD|nr:DNA alkylation repair protein [Clostridiales bacterium]